MKTDFFYCIFFYSWKQVQFFFQMITFTTSVCPFWSVRSIAYISYTVVNRAHDSFFIEFLRYMISYSLQKVSGWVMSKSFLRKACIIQLQFQCCCRSFLLPLKVLWRLERQQDLRAFLGKRRQIALRVSLESYDSGMVVWHSMRWQSSKATPRATNSTSVESLLLVWNNHIVLE